MILTLCIPFPLLLFCSSNLLKHNIGVKHGDLSSLGSAYLQMKILCRAATSTRRFYLLTSMIILMYCLTKYIIK